MGRCSKWRVYVQTFDVSGNYTGTWIEVTKYVVMDEFQAINWALDNTDYNIGIYRTSNAKITFRNDDGKFSDVGQSGSMFNWTRNNSLIKITWTGERYAQSGGPTGLIAGFFPAGDAWLLQETEIFRGFLNDDSLTLDLSDNKLSFDLLGLEYVLKRTFVNFLSIGGQTNATGVSFGSPGSIQLGSSAGPYPGPRYGQAVQFQISAGGTTPAEINASTYNVPGGSTAGNTSQTTYYCTGFFSSGGFWYFQIADSVGGSPKSLSGALSGTLSFTVCGGFNYISGVISIILNQTGITSFLTIGTINVGQDVIVDDWTPLANMSVWDALADLLLISNSVLYVQGTTITIAPRTPSASLNYTFFGQGSTKGPENVQEIKNIQSGISRTFNYFSWAAASTPLPDTLFRIGGTYFDSTNTITATATQNAVSIAKYGIRIKTFSQRYVASADNWQSLFASLLSEFGTPKQEFDLYCPLDPTTIALFLLNRVALDYPGTSTNKAFIETTTNNYKIEGVSLDPQTDLMCFSLRMI